MLKRILRLDGRVLTVFEWPGDKAILHYSWPQGESGLGVGYWVVMGFRVFGSDPAVAHPVGRGLVRLPSLCFLRFMRAALERKCFNQPCLPSMSITLTGIYLRHHRIKSCVLRATHTQTHTCACTHTHTYVHIHRFLFQQYISHSFCSPVILFYVLWPLRCWSPIMSVKPFSSSPTNWMKPSRNMFYTST